jgi:hypothetical protein
MLRRTFFKFQIVGWELGERLMMGKELTSSASYKYLNVSVSDSDFPILVMISRPSMSRSVFSVLRLGFGLRSASISEERHSPTLLLSFRTGHCNCFYL